MYALKARDKLHKREKKGDENILQRERSSGGQRRQPSTHRLDSKYVGTLPFKKEAGWISSIGKPVKQHLSKINPKDYADALSVRVMVNMNGVKITSAVDGSLVMAHALHRILYSTAETKKSLFAMVARNPQTDPKGVIFCHVFLLRSKEKANELNQLVGNAFRTAYARNSFKREKKVSNLSVPPTAAPTAPPTGTATSPPIATPTAPPIATPTAPPPPTLGHDHHRAADALPTDTASLEVHLLSLSRLHELEVRKEQQFAEGWSDDSLLGLVMEISTLQKQIEETEKQLHALQLQLTPASGHLGNSRNGSHGNISPIPPDLHDNNVGVSHDNEATSCQDNTWEGSSGTGISLDDAEWFQAGLPREIIEELLSQQPEGSFYVRESCSCPGNHALSLRVPGGGIQHYLIHQEEGRHWLQGSSLLFPSLLSLIINFSTDPGLLPCPLSMETNNPTFTEQDPSTSAEHQGGEDGDQFWNHHNYHLLD